MRHFMWDGFWGHGWAMGFGWLFWVLIIALAIWMAVKVAGSQGKKNDESALDILKKRYARGEITREEYKELEKDIRS